MAFGSVTGAFEGMGVPLAALVGPAVSIFELVGGLALVAGVLTRVVGLGVAAVMRPRTQESLNVPVASNWSRS